VDLPMDLSRCNSASRKLQFLFTDLFSGALLPSQFSPLLITLANSRQ
jgi:hypothetical protein